VREINRRLVRRILIANRGEIVLRVARTCSKLGLEPCGIYSDADTSSLHIKYCRETVRIGGRLPSESYLRMDKVIDAAKKMGCDLIHPGYGFLAESLQFSEVCAKEGLVFVGPSPAALALSGDKARAREVASEIAPILPGKEVSTESDALSLAEKIGFPVILKAVKGGGGRGLRIVGSQDELYQALNSSKKEAMISFGSSRLYIEKYLERPRHIEVQILGDNSKVIHLEERECSIQRRHQKLIEETPSPALTNDLRNRMTKTAIEIMKRMKYNNAGTVEFLFKEGSFYFMEVNSRIQVEHPITEQVTGIDVVEQQLRIATGEGLQIKQEDVKSRGHAIECRINAEHPVSFAPFSGTITKFIPPEDSDVRLDTALYSGYSIPSFYDSLIAKLICFGEDRSKAIERMKKSLMSFRIAGIPTTIPFHVSALNDERFLRGDYNTSFIDELKPLSSKDGEVAAAILSQLPKRTQFLKREEGARDPWMTSRFDGIQFFDVQHDYLQSRWFK
jgi:acetyl-CoA carboxylase biotin carboxylase subunit